jgi:hypothetical protein
MTRKGCSGKGSGVAVTKQIGSRTSNRVVLRREGLSTRRHQTESEPKTTAVKVPARDAFRTNQEPIVAYSTLRHSHIQKSGV